MSESEKEDELLTAEEVAERIGCKRRTILKWMSEGIIPAAIHRGKFIRFNMPDVRAALRKDADSQVP